MSGTIRQLVNNMVNGVSKGFREEAEPDRRGLQGHRPGQQAQPGRRFLAPGEHRDAAGITVATPTPTEVVIRAPTVSALARSLPEVRAVRPPEPHKGKGIRYADERS